MKMENEMSVSRHVELRIKGGSVYFFAGLAVCIGVILSYEYVWGDFTYKFPLKGLWGALASVLIYYLVQYLFTWMYIRDRKTYRWTKQGDCLWLKPFTLKQYRINQMVPFVLLGYLPLFFGFCSGYPALFSCGLLYSTLSVIMIFRLWQLRAFANRDLICNKEDEKEVFIIQRLGYGNK